MNLPYKQKTKKSEFDEEKEEREEDRSEGITYETTGVIVSGGFCVTEGLQQRIDFYKLVFEGSSSRTSSNLCNVLNDLLRVFSLTRTRLSGDEQRLICTIVDHGSVSGIRNSKDMREDFVSSLSSINIHNLRGVDGDLLVRIHCNQEKATISLSLREGDIRKGS